LGISVSSDMTGTVSSSDQSVAPPQPEALVTVNSSHEGVSCKNLCWREKNVWTFQLTWFFIHILLWGVGGQRW